MLPRLALNSQVQCSSCFNRVSGGWGNRSLPSSPSLIVKTLKLEVGVGEVDRADPWVGWWEKVES